MEKHLVSVYLVIDMAGRFTTVYCALSTVELEQWSLLLSSFFKNSFPAASDFHVKPVKRFGGFRISVIRFQKSRFAPGCNATFRRFNSKRVKCHEPTASGVVWLFALD